MQACAAGIRPDRPALRPGALLAGIRRRYAYQVPALTRLPCNFPLTATILLAVDSLLFGKVWHMTPYTASQRAQVLEQLLSLVDRAFDAQPVLESSTS